VVAGQISYLGQHFPTTDISVPGRRIFSLSWLRHQPDIGYTPVPMVPPENPLTGQALDMSYAVLRTVSAMYTGYLKNMGTNSSVVMTLLKDAWPWGLIACHHHSGPKFTAYEVRTACALLANMTPSLILEKEELEFLDYKPALKTTQAILIEAMSQHGDFAKVLIEG
jgi:two-component system, chemotaxis family, sensor kinase Cph1